MKVELYGKLAEAMGREVELAAPSGVTVAEARRLLAAAHPGAAEMLAAPIARALIDDSSADEHAPIPPRATLAFLPPLSGG